MSKHIRDFLEILLSKYKDPKLALWMKLVFTFILMWNLCISIFRPIASKESVVTIFFSMTLLLVANCLISSKKDYHWLDILTFLFLFIPVHHLFHNGSIGYFSVFYLLLFSVGTIFILGIRTSLLFQFATVIYLFFELQGNGSENLLNIYNTNLLLRFPYLYLCMIGIAYIIMFSIQRYWVEKGKSRLLLESKIKKEKQKLADVSLHIITSMYSALSAKIPDIDKHCKQVAEYSRELAQLAGLNDTMCTNAYYAGLLHEVGAVGLPDEIIQNSVLTDEQYELYKTYISRGYKIIRQLQIDNEIAEAVLYHRENYDGSGYQEGRFGKNIPSLARILALADYADRHIRYGESTEQICKKIREQSGTRFDPDYASKMCLLLEK